MFFSLLLLIGCRQTLLSPRPPPESNARKAWAKTLHKVVTEEGYVNYDKLEKNRKSLDDFVAWMSTPEAVKGPRNKDRHAFYLNAYNALVMFEVLERGRPNSVLDVPGWIPKAGSGFFLETQFKIGHDYLSLSEIEHERLRMKELDFRDHAAMNCASMSCPPLRNDLYRPEGLQGQLREQMQRWIMDEERGVRFENGEALFNPIFEWFPRDFSFNSAGENICEIAAAYATGEKAETLAALGAEGCPHRTFEYDWSLNEAP